jgi:hypothetical protein
MLSGHIPEVVLEDDEAGPHKGNDERVEGLKVNDGNCDVKKCCFGLVGWKIPFNGCCYEPSG